MSFVKLFVVLSCVTTVWGYGEGYCDICRNHTFCKYPVNGPSSECEGFDSGALLTNDDIEEIIHRINSRRNLIASGRLNEFPQAANMKKARWSTELASFAQRWAEQCDLNVRPNREDDCRDLVDMQVGQNVAAVLGPSPGLNVKSFVDMWFMQKLQYTGSVMYYNQSRDARTNYFTQLIWAETESVGCGKVKFFSQEINTVVERLICNFAPKGNNHGYPVYAIGYPATQCPKFMKADHRYPGLCKYSHDTVTEIVKEFSMNLNKEGLLRILDFSNNSVKQELDPNNLKQINPNNTEMNIQRNQRIRHVNLNKTQGKKCLKNQQALNSTHGIKRDSFHMQNPHLLNPLMNQENYKIHSFTPERGHSRMYHGYHSRIEPLQSTPTFPEQHFRRYDLATTATPYLFPIQNHESARRIIANNRNDNDLSGRRIFSNTHDSQCTRKTKSDCCSSHQVSKQCTRGQSHSCDSCPQAEPCISCLQPPLLSASPDPCVCNKQSPCCTETSSYGNNVQCQVCASHDCPMSISGCGKRRAQDDNLDTRKPTQFNNYYDLFPNLGMRSGDDNSSPRKQFENLDIENENRESEITNQVKSNAGNLQKNFRRPQDSFDIFYSSGRKKRDSEDQMTFKPFWQMEEYDNYKRPSELKSLRYTTLGNKRNKKARVSTKMTTETITIKTNDENIHDQGHVTEKYLSFEELMHLRKLSNSEGVEYKARRIGDKDFRKAATTKATSKAAATTKAAAATTKATTKAAAATKAGAATTKATTKAAATTKAGAATTKAGAATTKAGAATTKAAAATTKEPETTTMTANTPFIRLKQCTRKLTCTWTAMRGSIPGGGGGGGGAWEGAGGGGGGGGGGYIDGGSKTPPGYVDGCTRTSTCTRDYMDRNKMAATTKDENDLLTANIGDIGGKGDTGEDPDGDSEYCDKRSLNVQRRGLDDTNKNLSHQLEKALTEMTLSIPELNHVTNRDIIQMKSPKYKESYCSCDDIGRVKRNDFSKYDQIIRRGCNGIKDNKHIKSQDTYDYQNSLLHRFSKPSKLSKLKHLCPCNNTKSIHFIFHQLILLLCIKVLV